MPYVLVKTVEGNWAIYEQLSKNGPGSVIRKYLKLKVMETPCKAKVRRTGVEEV